MGWAEWGAPIARWDAATHSVPKIELRIQAIVETAKRLGFDPLAIPDRGKAEIRDYLLKSQPRLFTAATFSKAWQEASRRNLIRMKEWEKYLPHS